jgi:hypothetical protein
MKLFFLSLMVFSFVLHAADPIKVKGHYFSGEKKKDTFKKGNEVSKFEKKKSQLPERDLREAAFEKAGLAEEIKKMDEVDRDLLFYKAKNNSVEELKKEYPSIDIEKIKKLKSL